MKRRNAVGVAVVVFALASAAGGTVLAINNHPVTDHRAAIVLTETSQGSGGMPLGNPDFVIRQALSRRLALGGMIKSPESASGATEPAPASSPSPAGSSARSRAGDSGGTPQVTIVINTPPALPTPVSPPPGPIDSGTLPTLTFDFPADGNEPALALSGTNVSQTWEYTDPTSETIPGFTVAWGNYALCVTESFQTQAFPGMIEITDSGTEQKCGSNQSLTFGPISTNSQDAATETLTVSWMEGT